ncbi:hypothetical protein KOW79_018743 [Hemibagrus wyckioides]|uniref:Uncharacterized protein n=1 Tax=Hemibagrus wyckioides TaxID=337641 RepID=A0A9D3N7B7_9TELE|nr:hypothetical protein KOW79_018743 [Hemibagrus wyckioides]
MVSECLFSLINGDDMFATFKKMQQKSYLQQQLDGNPMSELQAFISEYKDHPNSGSYRVEERSSPCLFCCTRRSVYLHCFVHMGQCWLSFLTKSPTENQLSEVSAYTVYLTDDSNVALFPGGVSGVFSTLDLTPRGHYEVHGEDMDSTPAAGCTSQRFAFMRTPAAASADSPSQWAIPSPFTATKTFQR